MHLTFFIVGSIERIGIHSLFLNIMWIFYSLISKWKFFHFNENLWGWIWSTLNKATWFHAENGSQIVKLPIFFELDDIVEYSKEVFFEEKQAFAQEPEVKLNKTFVLQNKINDFQLHLWILSKKNYHNIADGTTSSCVHNAI